MAATRELVLKLDEDDWDTVHGYIADYQAHNQTADKGTDIPDGDSNLAGAIMAECVRNLLDYRKLWEAEHKD